MDKQTLLRILASQPAWKDTLQAWMPDAPAAPTPRIRLAPEENVFDPAEVEAGLRNLRYGQQGIAPEPMEMQLPELRPSLEYPQPMTPTDWFNSSGGGGVGGGGGGDPALQEGGDVTTFDMSGNKMVADASDPEAVAAMMQAAGSPALAPKMAAAPNPQNLETGTMDMEQTILGEVTKADADVSFYQQQADAAMTAATNPFSVSDKVMKQNLLSTLVNFGVGLAAGGGGRMGVGMGLAGAGAAGDAFWKQLAEQDELGRKAQMIRAEAYQKQAAEQQKYGQQMVEKVVDQQAKEDLAQQKGELIGSPEYEKLRADKERLKAIGRGREALPQMVNDALAQIDSATDIEQLQKIGTPAGITAEEARLVREARTSKIREMAEDRRKDYTDALLEGGVPRPLATKVTDGIGQAKRALLETQGVKQKVEEIYKVLPTDSLGRIASKEILGRIPSTDVQLLGNWLERAAAMQAVGTLGRQSLSDRDMKIFQSFLSGTGAFAAGDLIPRLDYLTNIIIQGSLFDLKNQIVQPQYQLAATKVANNFINDLPAERRKEAEEYLFGSQGATASGTPAQGTDARSRLRRGLGMGGNQ